MRTTRIILITLLSLFLISFIVSKLDTKEAIIQNKIAVIPIKGAITVEGTGDFFGGGGVSSNTVVEFIKKSNEDDGIKGIILEINSPGGGVVASEEIANAVKESEKPVVSWIREVGASGAYWIASASDVIVADPLSLTGSIGVVSSYLGFGGFIEEHNITYERLVSGKYKDTGTPFRGLKEDEREILQNKLDIVYDYFISDVANNRGMEKEKIQEIATGMFYLGSEAKELGLIDSLGGKDTALEAMKELTGFEELQLVSFQERRSLLEALRGVSAFNSFYIGKGIGSEMSKQIEIEKEFKLIA